MKLSLSHWYSGSGLVRDCIELMREQYFEDSIIPGSFFPLICLTMFQICVIDSCVKKKNERNI